MKLLLPTGANSRVADAIEQPLRPARNFTTALTVPRRWVQESGCQVHMVGFKNRHCATNLRYVCKLDSAETDSDCFEFCGIGTYAGDISSLQHENSDPLLKSCSVSTILPSQQQSPN
eukprot:2266163-Amphidinium_carterae.1